MVKSNRSVLKSKYLLCFFFQEAFYRIDHDYPMKCVEIAKECGVKHMSLLTSAGAKASSWFLYFQTKGQVQ